MSWNIFNGGQNGPEGSDRVFPRREAGRLDDVIRVLRSSKADVIFLQEANHFEADNHARLREFETKLGMKGALSLSRHGKFNVAAFYSKAAMVTELQRFSGDHIHAGLDMTFAVGDGQRLHLIAWHLLPSDRDSRLGAVRSLAPLIESRTPVVVIGDFNSLGSEAVGTDMSGLTRAQQKRFLDEKGEVDTTVIDAMKMMGFSDLHERFVGRVSAPPFHTVPTRLDKGEPNEFAPMRLDYAFANTAAADLLKSADVDRTDNASRASDHYPISISLDIGLEQAARPAFGLFY